MGRERSAGALDATVSTIASIHSVVTSALHINQVSRAVSVRAFLQLSADHGHLDAILAEMTTHVSAWFESKPARLYALGGAESGQLTVLVEFEAGQTALITAALLMASQAPVADLLVIGNHGTLRWDGGAGTMLLEVPYEPAPLGGDGQAIRAAVGESLRTAASVVVKEGT